MHSLRLPAIGDPRLATRVMTVTSSDNSSHSARFGKTSRLLNHADFDRVYRQGKRHFSQNMTVFWAKPSEDRQAARPQAAAPGPRIGLTVGKVLGGAVVRNRIKRRMREAVRMCLAGLKTPVDVVINPKKSALTAEMAKLQQEVSAAFAAIGKSSLQRTQRDAKGTQESSGI
jgi:ribonuclease P protein component